MFTAENVAAASLTGAALFAPILVFVLLIPVLAIFGWLGFAIGKRAHRVDRTRSDSRLD